MQELITRLTEKAGLSADQANKAIDTIKDFVKEKFPMMAGAVDNLLGSSDNATTTTDSSAPPIPSPSMTDKISDVIPGEMGEKVEDFAKMAVDKISGFMGGDKK